MDWKIDRAFEAFSEGSFLQEEMSAGSDADSDSVDSQVGQSQVEWTQVGCY